MEKILHYFESLIYPFSKETTQTPPTKLSKFYWFYIKQAKSLFIVLLIIGFFKTILEIALFEFIGRIIDILEKVSGPKALFNEYGISFFWIFLVILLARPIITILHNLILNQSLKTNFTSLIRWQQHRRLLQQSISFFHNHLSGSIANRVMNTGMSIRNSVILSIDSMWQVIIYALTTVVLFANLSPWLVLPLVLWIMSYIVMLIYFLPKSRHRSHISARARSALMGHIVDSYSNITTLKLFSHTAREEQQAEEVMQYQTDKALSSMRIITGLNISLVILNSLLIASVLVISLVLWQHAIISTGAIAFALSLIIRINSMSGWIMHVVSGIFEDIGSVQDGIHVMTAPISIKDTPSAKQLEYTQGNIKLDHITFAYHQDQAIFKDLSLTIQGGEKVALIGPSGAGKTTLINLILRLYDINQGSIQIDHQDIRKLSQDNLRAQIGVVTQDTSLLHRSIRDNLLYGNPNATDAELWEALERTKADRFVREVIDPQGRQGLDAFVGENGVKLSGGQRQRVAIARVLLKNAPILILDEATSALDSESEAIIQEYLNLLMQNKTVIAIAHRLSTVAKMDRLIVLDNGMIIESGTHDELIDKDGLYASLWNRQKI